MSNQVVEVLILHYSSCRVKILYLILSAPYKPWSMLFDNGIAKTWVKEVQEEGIDSCFLSLGKPLSPLWQKYVNRFLQSGLGANFWNTRIRPIRKVELEREFIMRTNRHDKWDNMFGKFIDCTNYALQNLEFDYLVRVNTTTHVNTEILRRDLMSRQVDYGGCRIKGEKCAAGWAMVFSREFLKDLVNYDFSKLELKGRYEDGVICRIAEQLNIEFKEFSFDTWENDMIGYELHNFGLVPFVRVKQSVGAKRVDDILHHSLWKLLGLKSEE